MGISLVLAIVILNYYIFQLPPEGNYLSMDSSVYLASIFVFGLHYTLTLLLYSSIVYALLARKIALWKHVSNFAIYNMMIIGASYIYQLSGGVPGPMDFHQIHAYVLSLSAYFLLNVFIIGLYYLITIKGNLMNVYKGIIKETISGYVSTLLLSLILTIMITTYQIYGLILLLLVTILLSIAFKQLFALYKEVSEKAIRDQRTGLYNHGYFETVMEQELTKSKELQQPLSLTIMDIDDFKKYNDAYGHLKGDRLLEFFGALIKEECETNGLFAARYGGEEFTILHPNSSEAEAFSFVNRLRKKLNDTFFEGVEVFPHGCISFSAGIIGLKTGIYDKSQFVDMADQALYFAKAQGKNLVHIYDDQSVVQKTFDIEREISEIEHQLKIFLSKDVYTYQHSKRVFEYAVEMSEKIGLNDYERKMLTLGALFHDIGKLEIPRDILNKKGKLTSEEWEIVKKHVLWGKEIASTNQRLKHLIPLIELHHERYDGMGYPHGLHSNEIPKLARILTVIDSFDAMTTERPYQKTKSFDEAFSEIRMHSGTQFDPEIVEPFIEMIMDKFYWKRNILNSELKTAQEI
ncbi:bifunctional diguanylate cyclase/phosphohydrolase [Ferviditalea candida]|uniref:Diguanylate cyclase n=1 Tax=Ferviditalea candida TaxID=3108399 RepID=A0ABU5ZIH8_9BACL|nr:diguanylate cyclase [Paenibacillaceae bacterium T2]